MSKALPPGSQQQVRQGGGKRGGAAAGIFDDNSNDGLSSSVVPKKPRFDEDDEDEDEEPDDSRSAPGIPNDTETAEKHRQHAIEMTANFLHNKLVNPSSVADLVLISLVVLPETMPAHFQASYTPIAAAGTEAQIRHLSRLMATQFTAKGFGPGADQLKVLVSRFLYMNLQTNSEGSLFRKRRNKSKRWKNLV